MLKIELDVKGLYSYNLTCFNPKKRFNKKWLSGSDWLTLYGALAKLAYENELDVTQAMCEASFSDDELYLNSFNGYQLSERLNLRTLYLSDDNKIIASIYDKKKDRYIDFITW